MEFAKLEQIRSFSLFVVKLLQLELEGYYHSYLISFNFILYLITAYLQNWRFVNLYLVCCEVQRLMLGLGVLNFDAMADYTARVHRDGLAGDSFIAGGG